ncbi:hypothetical protein [Laspinema olomoucense]|uniref:hypothetical protein n=1 Tax=Laspinema olomoucense TaxID=3231600 RepID=UPI0021BB361C|nr:hypothetical protein [Laspinema sp. D3d]MCT7971248.1 hypothetical protein [Laspinema sp. D3d]
MNKLITYFESKSLTYSDLVKLNYIASCSAFKSSKSLVSFGRTVKEIFGNQLKGFEFESIPESSPKNWILKSIWWVELDSTAWLELSNWCYQQIQELNHG